MPWVVSSQWAQQSLCSVTPYSTLPPLEVQFGPLAPSAAFLLQLSARLFAEGRSGPVNGRADNGKPHRKGEMLPLAEQNLENSGILLLIPSASVTCFGPV